MFCLNCNSVFPGAGLCCESCQDHLLEYYEPKLESGILSLYCYRDWLRELILRAKIQNSFTILQRLRHQFLLAYSDIQEPQFEQITEVMPIPSSLWGRVRGRFDIAHELASGLAIEKQLIFRAPPLQLGWHYSKQSRRSGRRRRSIKIDHSEAPELLLVDDIVTTGSSIEQVRRRVARPCVVVCFARSS